MTYAQNRPLSLLLLSTNMSLFLSNSDQTYFFLVCSISARIQDDARIEYLYDSSCCYPWTCLSVSRITGATTTTEVSLISFHGIVYNSLSSFIIIFIIFTPYEYYTNRGSVECENTSHTVRSDWHKSFTHQITSSCHHLPSHIKSTVLIDL